jgi:peptidoglycan/LPS O-acetylase OafA/YrhL
LSANAITGGDVSVQCFYIISGFFISLILNEKYVGPGDTYVFYSNRLIRIFSLYWVFLVVALIVGAAAFVVAHKGALAIWYDNWHRLRAGDIAFLVTTNIVLFGQDLTLFLGLGPFGLAWTSEFYASDPGVYKFMLIPQAWSLALELTFYLMAPFIVRRSAWTIGSIALICFAARVLAYAGGLQFDPWSYRFFPFELSLFLGGTLAYRLYRRVKGMALGLSSRLFGYGAIAAVLLFPVYDDGIPTFFSSARIGLYCYLILALPALFRMTKDTGWDRMAGELSYPVYLCHLIPIQLLQGSSTLAPLPVLRAFLAIVGSVALAVAAAKYIEIPLDKIRQSRIRGTRPRGLIETSALLVAADGAIEKPNQ